MTSYTKDQFLAAFKAAAAKPRDEFMVRPGICGDGDVVFSSKDASVYVSIITDDLLEVTMRGRDSLVRSISIAVQGHIFTEVAALVTDLFVAGTKHLSPDYAAKARRFAEAFNRAAQLAVTPDCLKAPSSRVRYFDTGVELLEDGKRVAHFEVFESSDGTLVAYIDLPDVRYCEFLGEYNAPYNPSAFFDAVDEQTAFSEELRKAVQAALDEV